MINNSKRDIEENFGATIERSRITPEDFFRGFQRFPPRRRIIHDIFEKSGVKSREF